MLLRIGLTSMSYQRQPFHYQRCMDLPQLEAFLLPSPEGDLALRNNFATLVSRVLVNTVDFFKLTFDLAYTNILSIAVLAAFRCKYVDGVHYVLFARSNSNNRPSLPCPGTKHFFAALTAWCACLHASANVFLLLPHAVYSATWNRVGFLHGKEVPEAPSFPIGCLRWSVSSRLKHSWP